MNDSSQDHFGLAATLPSSDFSRPRRLAAWVWAELSLASCVRSLSWGCWLQMPAEDIPRWIRNEASWVGLWGLEREDANFILCHCLWSRWRLQTCQSEQIFSRFDMFSTSSIWQVFHSPGEHTVDTHLVWAERISLGTSGYLVLLQICSLPLKMKIWFRLKHCHLAGVVFSPFISAPLAIDSLCIK